jgi:hypothetical protein
MRRIAFVGLTWIALAAPARPAVAAEEPAPAAVAKAIEAGSAWLRGAFKEGFAGDKWSDPVELVALTLAHCGANLSDPVFRRAVETCEAQVPRFTYRTALLAMALAEVNPRQYQRKIAHCAQWLVDTQGAAGEWGYPGAHEGSYLKTEGVTVPPPEEPGAEEGAKEGAKPSDRPVAKWVLKRRDPPAALANAKGDFSNTQFAVLGLRAARDAGIEVPKETWTAALAYLRRFQRPEGGWGYVLQGEQDEASYASLTCAGACSTAICVAALGGGDPKADPGVKKALGWLKKHLDVARNVGIDRSAIAGPRPWQYYHLYSLERAARVLGLKDVEGRAWYPLGATWLLAQQQPDGAWVDEGGADPRHPYYQVADTCFALLFLTRATRPLTGK